jgi:hypothetical protein
MPPRCGSFAPGVRPFTHFMPLCNLPTICLRSLRKAAGTKIAFKFSKMGMFSAKPPLTRRFLFPRCRLQPWAPGWLLPLPHRGLPWELGPKKIAFALDRGLIV